MSKIQKFRQPVLNKSLLIVPILEESSTDCDTNSDRAWERCYGNKYPTGKKCLNFVGKDGEVIPNDLNT